MFKYRGRELDESRMGYELLEREAMQDGSPDGRMSDQLKEAVKMYDKSRRPVLVEPTAHEVQLPGSQNDVYHDDKKQEITHGAHLPTGWQAGQIRAALCAVITFALVLSVDAWLFSKTDIHRGVGTVFEGPCSAVKAANTVIHLALNVLSTLLLSASNFSMQALCAPTRAQVDRAHANRQWLDIGIQSVRNLRFVGYGRLSLWTVLGVTSVLLHLIFNSVFFVTNQANQYAVAVVAPAALTHNISQLDCASTSPSNWPDSSIEGTESGNISFANRTGCPILPLIHGVVSSSTNYKELSREDCITQYSKTLVQDTSNVVVVAKSSTSLLYWARWPERYRVLFKTNGYINEWVCHDVPRGGDFSPDDRCALDVVNTHTRDGGNWTVYGTAVDYCMAQTVENTCKLQYNAWLMLAVVIFSGLKTVVIVYMALSHRTVRSLRTVGDAVASFLQHHDDTTAGMCMATGADMEVFVKDSVAPQARPYIANHLRWFQGMEKRYWYGFHSLAFVFIILLGLCVYFADDGAQGTGFATGLGQPDLQNMDAVASDDGGGELVGTILVANIPQIVFAMVYVGYNSLFTKMLLAREWSRFGCERKGLRLSGQTRGRQRNSHFFSLPTRYAVPLMAYSAVVHWLLSQSLFLVRVESLDMYGQPVPDDIISRLGYSVIGIIASMTLILVGEFVAILFGHLRSLDSSKGPPGHGSSSLVISAACHHLDSEGGVHLQEVQWGDVSENQSVETAGHCAFSGRSVPPPTEGRLYR